MKLKEYTITDALFVFRLVGTLTHSTVQLHHMLRNIEGVSLSMFLCLTLFFASLFRLSWKTNKDKPARIHQHILIGYLIGFLLALTGVLILIWHWGNGRYTWGTADEHTLLMAGGSSLIVLIIGRLRKLPNHDPLVQGWLAVAIKAVPQAFLALKMWQEGGAGYTAIAIWLSHLLMFIRVVQVATSWIDSPKREVTGMVIAEVSNWFTWGLVTIAWLYGGPR